MFSNDIVNSHIRNMSIAQHVSSSRPPIHFEPKIVTPTSSPRSSDEEDRDKAGVKIEKIKNEGLIKDRSPLADLLYLRWLDGLKLKWPMQ